MWNGRLAQAVGLDPAKPPDEEALRGLLQRQGSGRGADEGLGGALLLCSIGLYKLLTLGLVVEDYERHATRIAQGFIFGISLGIAAFYRSIVLECLRDVEQRYFPVQQADDDDDEQALRLANEDAEGDAGDQYLAP